MLAGAHSYSPVFDLEGNPIQTDAEKETSNDDTADYEMACDCGVNLEFRTPDDATLSTVPSSAYTTSPRVYRLY